LKIGITSKELVVISKSNYRHSLLITAAAPIFWSVGGLGIRIVSVSPWETIFWRGLFMALTILLFLSIRDGNGVIQTFRKMGVPGLMIGVLLAFTSIFYVLSVSYTSVANALVLQGTSTFFAAILGWLTLHERVRIETWIAITVTIASMAFMFSGSLASGKLWGDIFGLMTAVVFAGNILTIRAYREVDMVPASCLGGLFSAIITFPMMDTFSITLSDLGLLAFLGSFQLGLGCYLFIKGSANLPPAQTALLALLETVLGPLWVWLILNEMPTVSELIGGTAILITLALHSILTERRR
jgi:drug/metabolite transporter (DMT)-like permease